MKKILIPIGGSQSSQKTLETGKDFALKYSAEVMILNVVAEASTINVENKIDVISVNLSAGEEIVKHAREDFEKNGISVTGKCLVGDVGNVIVDVAKEFGADLIIMGSRGLGVISRALLGSVSSKVVHNSECSVMVVK